MGYLEASMLDEKVKPKPRYKYTVTSIRPGTTDLIDVHIFEGTEYYTDEDGFGYFVDDPDAAGQPKRAEWSYRLSALYCWTSELIEGGSMEKFSAGEQDYQRFLDTELRYIPAVADVDPSDSKYIAWASKVAYTLARQHRWSLVMINELFGDRWEEISAFYEAGSAYDVTAELLRDKPVEI